MLLAFYLFQCCPAIQLQLLQSIAQKMRFFIKLSSLNLGFHQFPVNLIKFTEEIFHEKLYFLCIEKSVTCTGAKTGGVVTEMMKNNDIDFYRYSVSRDKKNSKSPSRFLKHRFFVNFS